MNFSVYPIKIDLNGWVQWLKPLILAIWWKENNCRLRPAGKKVSKTLSLRSWAWWYRPLISAARKAEMEESCSKTGIGKSTRPYLKDN
jgi:hypothetical protein